MLDAFKAPDAISNHILAGVMAFVVGILTILRVTRGIPRKITHAAVDYANVYCADTMVKGQANNHRQQPGPAAPPAEYAAVLKRLGELEEKVSAFGKKPAETTPEKEEILNAAVRRIGALETELEATKKVLHIEQEFAPENDKSR